MYIPYQITKKYGRPCETYIGTGRVVGNPQLSPLSVAKYNVVCHSSEYQHRFFLHMPLTFGSNAVIELKPTAK